MLISLDEAKKIVESYVNQSNSTWFSLSIEERDSYWFFHVGYIGSSGVIVDKKDGKLSVMGSSLSIDDMFWGHEHGFSEDLLDIKILSVSEKIKVSGMVGSLLVQLGQVESYPMRLGREKAREIMENLPIEIKGVNLWLNIPWFREASQERWLEYDIKPSVISTK